MNETDSRSPLASPQIYGDEIDLREFFLVMWAAKWKIVGVTLVAAVISAIVALTLPNIYRSEALLAPASGEGASGLSALASQYGGLANLAGINLGSMGAGTDRTALGIEVLESRKFLGEFVERHNLLPDLIAVKGWKSSGNQLEYDSDIYDFDSGVWMRNVKPPKQAIPSLLEAHKAFLDILSVTQDSDTGFVYVSVQHFSPHVAKQWVDLLVYDLNNEIRNQDISEAERSINYLREQLSATSLADLQAIFYELIEDQMKTIMLANARPEYLFKTLDPAVAREEPSAPNRLLICMVGLFLGVFLGIAYVVFESYVYRVKV